MSNLVRVYQSLGWHSKAAHLGARTLELKEEVLGAKHPSTLASVGSLARTYRSQKRYKEAADLERKRLSSRERCLGSGHDHRNSLHCNECQRDTRGELRARQRKGASSVVLKIRCIGGRKQYHRS
jgi:hypothetical protein